MKTEIIQSLTNDFESYARQTENEVEFWLARDLQCLLGYTDWRNFLQVVNRAKVACEVSEHRIIDHFVDANKMVSLGSGSQREVPDMMEKQGTTKGRDKKTTSPTTLLPERAPWALVIGEVPLLLS